MSNRIHNTQNDGCRQSSPYLTCPACGEKKLPNQARGWGLAPELILYQSTCIACESTRTIAKIEHGVLSIEVRS